MHLFAFFIRLNIPPWLSAKIVLTYTLWQSLNPIMRTSTIKKLLLGVTGGIAAYKAAELVRLLVKADIDVQVVMTNAARQFIGPATMQALSGQLVLTDMWDDSIPNGMPHIELSREADAILIAPASADFLAKLAHGHADDLLSALCLARDCPLLVAPAMNRQMWEHPATQRNVAQLIQDDTQVLGPDTGEQACGETGIGRMLEPEAILTQLLSSTHPLLFKHKRILITAGPTIEMLDPVRAITNLSSGKMGYAMAHVARQLGATVTLISGPTHLPPPAGVDMVHTISATDMHDAVMAHIADQDIFISVAAVADYRPINTSPEKIKKHASTLTIELTANPDILATVSALPSPPYCVGFAAETEHLLAHAEAKRRKKHLPLLVANLVQDSLGQDDTHVVLLDDQGQHALPRASKAEVARAILNHIATQLNLTTEPHHVTER